MLPVAEQPLADPCVRFSRTGLLVDTALATDCYEVFRMSRSNAVDENVLFSGARIFLIQVHQRPSLRHVNGPTVSDYYG